MKKYAVSAAALLVACAAYAGLPDFKPSVNAKKAKAQGIEAPAATYVAAESKSSRRRNDDSSDRELQFKVDFRISRRDNVVAVVTVNDNQIDRVFNRDGYIEVRMYMGDRNGQEKKIGAFPLHSNPDQFVFLKSDVCPDAGTYQRHLKVAASARNSDGTKMEGYKTDWNDPGNKYTVSCSPSLIQILLGW